MKKLLIRIASFILMPCIILACFTGCNAKNEILKLNLPRYNADKFSSNYSGDGIVCENEYLQLIWDDTRKTVSFKDKQTGTVWGQIPEEAISSGQYLTHSIKSAVQVYYLDANNLGEQYAYSSYGAVEDGNIWTNKIENGLSVTYDFSMLYFSVTVDYVLDGSKFTVSVDPRKMSDDGRNYITGVAVLPFVTGVKNDSKTDWLFMPDGSGAVIEPKTINQMGVDGIAKVYGEDLAIQQYYAETNKQQINMPVFGTVREKGGLFAVITSGAEHASLGWSMGSSTVGYSTVYPHFRLRGYSLEDTPDNFGWTALSHIKLFDESVVETVFKVDYNLLPPEKANLNGMAEVYREYLKETHGLSKSKVEETSANYKFVGGTIQPTFILGIPSTKLFPLTTTEQVKEITSEIKKSIGNNFTVNLVGFGKSGVDVGQVAGGFTVASKLGGFKGYKKLTDYLKEIKVNSFMDFDVLSMGKSGAGFSFTKDAATLPNGPDAIFSTVNSVSRATYTDNYHILSRQLLPDAVLKVLDKKDKLNGSGISLNSLSNTIYSDYSYSDFRNAKNMPKDVKTLLDAVKKQNIKLSAASANDYAASVADVLTDCPISSSVYDFETYSVPFYQMVFKGYKPMSSVSLNLTSEESESFLTCIESGMAPSYTIIANYDNELKDSKHNFIYGSVYKNQKKAFVEKVKEAQPYYESIKGAEILNYTIVNDYVRITEFDNGVYAVVNYGDTEYSSQFGVVPAKSFITGSDR